MAARVKNIVRLTWIGLIDVILALVAAWIITWRWGPLWDMFGFVTVAAGLMVLLFLALAGLEEFIRPPNPYTRVHPMFSYLDLGPAGELRSSDPSLMLMGAPLLIGAGFILLIGWLL